MAAPDPRWSAHAFGTAQSERANRALDPASAPLDDRDALAQLARLRNLAQDIAYYGDSPARPSGNWLEFFPADTRRAALEALAARTDGEVTPHLALLLAWLQQAERSRELLNDVTRRHLDFQMRQVLGFVPHAPVPDRAHLLLELKNGAPAVAIGPQVWFSAGKDKQKVEQLFHPVRDVVVGHARVESLCSVLRDGDALRFAPMADSADGLGAPLAGAERRWPAFGQARASRPPLPFAPVGFAFASPTLRLAGGTRQVRLVLGIDGLDALDVSLLTDALQVHVSSAQGWSGPYPLSASRAADQLTLSFTLDAADPAVVDHRPDLHLQRFPSGAPVVQVLLKPGARYGALAALRIHKAQICVEVAQLRELEVENDTGALDASKPFLPFGAQPVGGSRLHVGCREALGKSLTSLRIRIAWHAPPPAPLSDWYNGYSNVARIGNGVAATVAWKDARGAERSIGVDDLLKRDQGITTLTAVVGGGAPATSPASRIRSLRSAGSGLALRRADRLERMSPILRTHAHLSASFTGFLPAPSTRAGFVTIALLEDFLHADYRKEAVAKLLARTPLNEPYTPKVQDLSIDYQAQSDVSHIDDSSETAFADTDVQFFHVDAFGIAREHGWLTRSRSWSPQDGIALLPRHPRADQAQAGELMIGLSGLAAGDPVSLLLQIADGSADPEAQAVAVTWSVLADDAWRQLAPGELVLDTTGDLRRSGVVALVLPRAQLTANTRMAPGLVWLRAHSTNVAAASDLIGIHANAVEVVFEERGNDPERLATALPAGSITKLHTPVAAIKSAHQPYATFGGARAESEPALAQRACERLRHRGRALCAWDWERLVLQAFPRVARAKCVAHASPSSWQAPGHVMVLVVPDLRNRNAVDPLRPRVDLDTLVRIREFLQARCAMATEVVVRNPRYVAVALDFKVKMRHGHAFSFYRQRLDDALIRALSPWAFDHDAASSPNFGGRVLRSVLLDFVEDLPYVDFVTDFRLHRQGDPADVAEVAADTPDTILVSAAGHGITEVSDG